MPLTGLWIHWICPNKESVRFLIETLEDVNRNFSTGKKSEEKK